MLRKHWCIYIAGYVIHKDVPVDVKETLVYIYCWLCYTQGCTS